MFLPRLPPKQSRRRILRNKFVKMNHTKDPKRQVAHSSTLILFNWRICRVVQSYIPNTNFVPLSYHPTVIVVLDISSSSPPSHRKIQRIHIPKELCVRSALRDACNLYTKTRPHQSSLCSPECYRDGTIAREALPIQHQRATGFRLHRIQNPAAN